MYCETKSLRPLWHSVVRKFIRVETLDQYLIRLFNSLPYEDFYNINLVEMLTLDEHNLTMTHWYKKHACKNLPSLPFVWPESDYTSI